MFLFYHSLEHKLYRKKNQKFKTLPTQNIQTSKNIKVSNYQITIWKEQIVESTKHRNSLRKYIQILHKNSDS